MIKPINLYLLSRINDVKAFKSVLMHNCVEKDALNSDIVVKCQRHEIKSLQALVNTLVKHKCGIFKWEGFFYNYIIPQIGKEFDLLKIVDGKVLNIELKSKAVELERIEKQLRQNRHYLAPLNRKIYSFTVVTDSLKCFTMDEDDVLRSSSIEELATVVGKFCQPFAQDIQRFFCPSQFLISPLSMPEAFLQGRYFLTDHQEKIKSHLLSMIDMDKGGYFCIKGEAGTGKTLLLYDIALQLARLAPTLIVHCAKLPQGYQQLNNKVDNFSLVPIESVKDSLDTIAQYKFVLLDECHRIYANQLQKICDIVADKHITCIISLDPNQTLSLREQHNDIFNKVNALPLTAQYELTTHIRTNKELAFFMRYVFDLNKKPPRNIRYKNINVCFAGNNIEALGIIEYFRSRGYVFINYTDNSVEQGNWGEYGMDYDTHHVIGQEFDKVLVVLNNAFYHDEKGKLCARVHNKTDYLYEKMLYQNITRAKDKLALIVVENEKLFKEIVTIFNYER